MDEKELDLSQVNQIDMECAAPDDDDTFLVIKPSKVSTEETPMVGADDRNLVTKLGIFADFSDGDEDPNAPKIIADVVELPSLTVGAGKASSVEQEILNAQNGVMTPEQINRADLTGINIIDTECSVGEDDDVEPTKAEPGFHPISKQQLLDFGDEENETSFDKGLLEKKDREVEEKMDGSVDANYWKKMQDKYNKANKKSMGPVHGHWCADPEAEKDMFNHDNTPSGPVVPQAGRLGTAGGGQEGSMADAGLPSLGEDLTPSEATKKFKELIDFMDYKVVKNEEGNGYMLRDEIYHADNYPFKTLDELITVLQDHCDLDLYADEEMKDIINNHRDSIQLALL